MIHYIVQTKAGDNIVNPGACAGRKLGEKTKHRVEAKIAPLANIMRYHDSNHDKAL